ncbi:hypothetical protein C8Q70DRAFT_969918 [Cubamyces menziesii]|nr:hypothetical protein C8Q70DRAFT_969918 [Cubamyces menziesii]
MESPSIGTRLSEVSQRAIVFNTSIINIGGVIEDVNFYLFSRRTWSGRAETTRPLFVDTARRC